jgi:hypothetical protein
MSDSPLNENSISETEHHLLSLGANLQRHFPDIINDVFPLIKTPLTFEVLDVSNMAEIV